MSIDGRISLYKLEVFCKVVELGGMQKAAQDLFVSQPVVSAHVRSLQERLGVELFRRSGRGVALTEAGQEAHRWALDVLHSGTELESSLRNLVGGSSGSAVVAASMTAGNVLVTPALVTFGKAHPAAQLRLEVSAVEVAIDSTRAGRAQLCVVGTDAVLDSKEFVSELIGRPAFALVTAKTNTTLPSVVSAEDLSDLSFICPPGGLAMRRSQDAALASIGVVNRRVAIELGSAEAIRKAVAADLGVALLWRVSLSEPDFDHSLREIRIDAPTMRDQLYIVHRTTLELTPLQKRLAHHIKESVAAALGSEC